MRTKTIRQRPRSIEEVPERALLGLLGALMALTVVLVIVITNLATGAMMEALA